VKKSDAAKKKLYTALGAHEQVSKPLLVVQSGQHAGKIDVNLDALYSQCEMARFAQT
jgi:hypothetical protein